MYILDQDGHPNIISWLPHGRGFLITDKKRLETEVLPKYFKVSKFTSFTRRLNRWEFTIHTMGHKKSSYFHPKFIRHDPRQCLEMFPAPQNKKRSTSAIKNKRKQKSAAASKTNGSIEEFKKKSVANQSYENVTKKDLSLPPFVHDTIHVKSRPQAVFSANTEPLSGAVRIHHDNQKLVQNLPNQMILQHQQILYNLSNAGNAVLPAGAIHLGNHQSPSQLGVGNPTTNIMTIGQAQAYLPNPAAMNSYTSSQQQAVLPVTQGSPYVYGNATQQHQHYPLTTLIVPNLNLTQGQTFTQQFAPIAYPSMPIDSSSVMLKQHPSLSRAELNN